jgi:predicted TIM-barrel fold metal-dependent hydrolase
VLPTAAPADAASELERSVTQLGLAGAMLCGRTRDKNLDHADFRPMFKTAEMLGVPLFCILKSRNAIAVVATVASVHHRRKKIVITGCVISGENGMTVTDEEDRKIYALSGNMTDIKPGDRMKLEGKE